MIQTQVKQLYDRAYELIHLGDTDGMVYIDDFTRLNKEIYELINQLWNKHGKTVEEESRLCSALLMGFSVSMYANPTDEKKRDAVMERAERVLEKLDHPELKELLSALSF